MSLGMLSFYNKFKNWLLSFSILKKRKEIPITYHQYGNRYQFANKLRKKVVMIGSHSSLGSHNQGPPYITFWASVLNIFAGPTKYY